MLFILFDIEVVFLYPVGRSPSRRTPVFVLAEVIPLCGPALRGTGSTSGGREPWIGDRTPEASGSRPLEQPQVTGRARARQLKARDMLRGDLTGEDLDKYVEERGRHDHPSRRSSTRPVPIRSSPATFGLACCAIEMMSTVFTAL